MRWLLLLVLAGCASKARVDNLEQRMLMLEAKVAEMQRPAPGVAAGAVDAEAERLAGELLQKAQEQLEAMDYEAARQTLQELQTTYGTTRVAKRAERMMAELEVLGTDPGPLEVERWYQGEASFADAPVTLLVFFETWCPHCTREVPKLQQAYDTWRPRGMNVVAVTKVSRNATDETVQSFITEHGITYPVAKELDGSLSERFNVTGIPAAAVVKDGKIVWRGHPARLTEAMFQTWIDG